MAGLTSKEAQVEVPVTSGCSRVPFLGCLQSTKGLLSWGGGVIPGSARNGKLENGNEGCHLGWHHQKKEAFKLDAYICA